MAAQNHLMGSADPVLFKVDVLHIESGKMIKTYIAIKVDPPETQFQRVSEVLETSYRHTEIEVKKMEQLGILIWESDK